MKNQHKLISILILLCASQLQAAVLLTVDFSTEDRITIAATDGLSAATNSTRDYVGIYLHDFFGVSGTNVSASFVSGNLSSALNAPAASSSLQNSSGSDPGLNFYNFSLSGTIDFVANIQAFAGSSTWNISAVSYQQALTGPVSGAIYAGIDSLSGVPGTEIGTWQKLIAESETGNVPSPGNLLLMIFGLAVSWLQKNHIKQPD